MSVRLALFDLDHTLIPFDSGLAWTRFLVAQGVLPPQAEAEQLARCQQYVAGSTDIRSLHQAGMALLRPFTRVAVAGWLAGFEDAMAPRVSAARRALVARHRDAGDLCAIVTATPCFIAEPFARTFGVPHLVATEVALDGERYGTQIVGDPCHGAHKPVHVRAWLGTQRLRWEDVDESWFYSDAASDLPLLDAVTHPVAVCPDARLRVHAVAAGWTILEPQ